MPHDVQAAPGWYRKAADEGDAGAQYNLGAHVRKRPGGAAGPCPGAQVVQPRDISLRAHPKKQSREMDVKNRDAVSASMTPTQIAEAQRQASEWTPKHTKSAPGPSIAMDKDGGTFVVPVLINNAITLDFVVDSGATDVSIPEDVVNHADARRHNPKSGFPRREDLYPC